MYFPTIHPKKVKMQKNVDCLVKLFMSEATVSVAVPPPPRARRSSNSR